MSLRNEQALTESRSFTVRPIPALRPLGWLLRTMGGIPIERSTAPRHAASPELAARYR